MTAPGHDRSGASPPGGAERRRGARRRSGWARTLWLVLAQTARQSVADRVTGLAAEAGFWALASLPPLAIGLLGTIGYLRGPIGADGIADIRSKILSLAGVALSAHTVDTVVRPVVDQVLGRGRVEVVSIGFALSLWSGSRAMNVYVDAITIAYRLHGIRGVLRGRITGFLVYLASLAAGIVIVPLLLAGPRVAQAVVGTELVSVLYWPVVVAVSVALLATLYHVSIPVRTPWRRTLPGAAVALLLWLGGSAALRLYLSTQVRATSAYGQLGAIVALMFWLYITALAVLIGAELGAVIDLRWPSRATAAARADGRGDADIGGRVPWRVSASGARAGSQGEEE